MDARECHVFIISPIVAGVAAAVNATTGLWHAALCDVRSAAPVCVHQVMLSVHMAAGVVADMDQIGTANPSKDSPGDYIIIKLYRVPLSISHQWNRSGCSLLFC